MTIESANNILSISADSHVGLIRELNEDSFAFWQHPSSKNYMIALADGIGGHENGDIASCLCVKTLLTCWRNNGYCMNSSETDMLDFLNNTILRTNEIIHGYNVAYDIQHPMGTTIVAGVFMEDRLIVAHAGDSRCYRLKNGGMLERLTRDHSIVEELVRKGVIKEEEAKEHPFAHIISRSVGPCPDLEPELQVFKHTPGDKYLFCSDGLVNHVKDKVIQEMLANSESADDAVKRLLYASLRAGGEDNITIIAIFTKE